MEKILAKVGTLTVTEDEVNEFLAGHLLIKMP